jgi:guanylate kinase
MNEPPLIIVSGPSGSGKSTVIARVMAAGDLPLHLSVSATTRPRRPGERNGVHYHFWTPEQFEKELAAGEFLEWARVHGSCYGTLRREVEPYRRRGVMVILDIDVQGAGQIRRACPDQVSIFLRTASLETYQQRLRARGTEDEAAIRRRVESARGELAYVGQYDYEIINDNLDAAVARFRQILLGLLQGDPHAR